jgi:hypothetical protein
MHAPSLGGQVIRLILEVGVLLAATLLLAAALGRRRRQSSAGPACAAVISVAAVALFLGQVRSSASLLNQARRLSFPRVAAADYCFAEGWPQNPNGRGATRLPFARRVRATVGRNGVYELSYAPPPDPDCLLLGLLPALPAAPGERAGWAVAFGQIPPGMNGGTRDRRTERFGRELALERLTR